MKHEPLTFSIFDSRGHPRPVSSFSDGELLEFDGEQVRAFEKLTAASLADEAAETELARARDVLTARVRDLNEARDNRFQTNPVSATAAAKAHIKRQHELTRARHGVK